MYFVILRSQYILDSKNVYLLRSIIKNNKKLYIYIYRKNNKEIYIIYTVITYNMRSHGQDTNT